MASFDSGSTIPFDAIQRKIPEFSLGQSIDLNSLFSVPVVGIMREHGDSDAYGRIGDPTMGEVSRDIIATWNDVKLSLSLKKTEKGEIFIHAGQGDVSQISTSEGKEFSFPKPTEGIWNTTLIYIPENGEIAVSLRHGGGVKFKLQNYIATRVS